MRQRRKRAESRSSSALQLFLVRERGHSFIREHVTGALTHASDLRSAIELELQGIRLSQSDSKQRLEARTRPGLLAQREARDRLLEYLDLLSSPTPNLLGGEADIRWISFRLPARGNRRRDRALSMGRAAPGLGATPHLHA